MDENLNPPQRTAEAYKKYIDDAWQILSRIHPLTDYEIEEEERRNRFRSSWLLAVLTAICFLLGLVLYVFGQLLIAPSMAENLASDMIGNGYFSAGALIITYGIERRNAHLQRVRQKVRKIVSERPEIRVSDGRIDINMPSGPINPEEISALNDAAKLLRQQVNRTTINQNEQNSAPDERVG